MKPIIRVKNISKTFKIPLEPVKTLKGRFINPFRGRAYETFHALKDVSFDVMPGEWVGIIGRNGSGKSTLLKIIAGIYAPDKGRVKIRGRMVPFLELGVGFNPELSARENIFLNGVILGMSRKEIAEKFDEIVKFAEVERFIDQKLKNFSSGMQVRLAFAVAMQAKGDVYLLDEVLAVGDAGFQSKCLKALTKLKAEGKTVLFVSHDLRNIEKHCDRCILLDEHTIAKNGNAQDTIAFYHNLMNEHTNKERSAIQQTIPVGKQVLTNIAMIKDIKILNKDRNESYILNNDDPLFLKITIEIKEPIKELATSCSLIRNEDGLHISFAKKTFHNLTYRSGDTIELEYKQILNLHQGQYYFHLAIGPLNMNPLLCYDFREGMPVFTIFSSPDSRWIMDTHPEISLTKTT